MGALAYIIFTLFTILPLIGGIIMIVKGNKVYKCVGVVFTIPFFYMLICTLNTGHSSASRNYKTTVLSGEQDFLMGTDYFHAYSDSSFYIFYADEAYTGTYKLIHNKVILDIDPAWFQPLRNSFPETLIIQDRSLVDPQTGSLKFNLYQYRPEEIYQPAR